MTMRFKIGDKIWRPIWTATESSVECPDCAGTGRIRVIFADDSIVSIECKGCARGFAPPTGRVTVYCREAVAVPDEIVGINIDHAKIEWRTRDSYIVDDTEAFATEAEALAFAKEKAARADANERAKIFQKEKDTRSWAWNASYHRKCLKEATRQIEYHTAKLNVASLKAKQGRSVKAGVA